LQNTHKPNQQPFSATQKKSAVFAKLPQAKPTTLFSHTEKECGLLQNFHKPNQQPFISGYFK